MPELSCACGGLWRTWSCSPWSELVLREKRPGRLTGVCSLDFHVSIQDMGMWSGEEEGAEVQGRGSSVTWPPAGGPTRLPVIPSRVHCEVCTLENTQSSSMNNRFSHTSLCTWGVWILHKEGVCCRHPRTARSRRRCCRLRRSSAVAVPAAPRVSTCFRPVCFRRRAALTPCRSGSVAPGVSLGYTSALLAGHDTRARVAKRPRPTPGMS